MEALRKLVGCFVSDEASLRAELEILKHLVGTRDWEWGSRVRRCASGGFEELDLSKCLSRIARHNRPRAIQAVGVLMQKLRSLDLSQNGLQAEEVSLLAEAAGRSQTLTTLK